MSKELTLQQIRKKFVARTSQIKREHEKKIRALEAKIEEHKKDRNDRLAKAEKQFRKDFGVVIKWIIGEEDYRWLSKWLMTNIEKDIEEAEKSHKTKHLKKLKEMSAEDYLLYYFNNPEIEERLKKEMKSNKSEDAKRLAIILGKLKAEYLRFQGTRF